MNDVIILLGQRVRSWYDFSIRVRKKLNFISGRSFVNNAKQWAKTARIISDLEEEKIMKFKYEDLNNSEEGIAQLLKHYNLKVDKDIIKNCLNAPVVGSSFGNDINFRSKPKWTPDPDKSKYVFTNKWKKWSALKKLIFKQIAGKELIELGYEKNNNW